MKNLTNGRARVFTPSELRAFVEVLRIRPEFLITGQGNIVEAKRVASARATREARAPGLRHTGWSAVVATMPIRYESLVNEILIGVALADAVAVRMAIDDFVANASSRPTSPSFQAKH